MDLNRRVDHLLPYINMLGSVIFLQNLPPAPFITDSSRVSQLAPKCLIQKPIQGHMLDWEGDLVVTSVTPLIARVDSADMTG